MKRQMTPLLGAAILLCACAGSKPRHEIAHSGEPLRATMERANLALREARLLDAEILYRDLSRRHPRLPEVWLQLGNIYTRQSQLEAAVRAYKDGLALTPEDGRLWHNLAVVELKQAIRTLEAASQILSADNPHRSRIRNLHGRLLDGASPRAGTQVVSRKAREP